MVEAVSKLPPLITSKCDRCGGRLRVGLYTYSRFTKNHYCVDLDACKVRANKRKGKA